MLQIPSWSSRVQNAGLAVAVVVAVGLTVAALGAGGRAPVSATSAPAGPGPSTAAGGGSSTTTTAAPATTSTGPGAATTTAAPRGAASGVPADVRALFFGDGLMVGDPTATPSTLSERTAAELGWTTTIDARPGSGFTTPGARSYLARVTAAVSGSARYDVVVVEGGANDVDLGPTPAALGAQVDEVVAAVRAAQPQAAVVLVGVYSPPGVPVSAASRAVDDVLVARARALDVPVVSPLADGWLDGRPASDTGRDGYTPSAAGAEHLAQRLAGALRGLVRVPVQP